MLKTISLEDFKKSKGVSYSKLSKLADSPQAYQKALKEEVDSSSVSIGSAVDLLLTDPDNFNDEIYVMSTNKPSSDMMQVYVDELLRHGDSHAAWANSGYKLAEEKVHAKFLKEGKAYYDAIKQAEGKKILGINDMMIANTIVSRIKEHPEIGKYFQTDDKYIELHFQVPIVWDFDYHSLVSNKKQNMIAKSVLDILVINHRTQSIIPVELKTGAEGFMKSYWKYKRWLQGGMYYDAVKSLNYAHNNGQKYIVENTIFIYADTNLYYPPIIYKMTDRDITIARRGRLYKSVVEKVDEHATNKHKVKGYLQLAAELEWHQAMNLWDYSHDVYKNNYSVNIDAFSIKL